MNRKNIVLSTVLIGCLVVAILVKMGIFDKKGDRKIFSGKVEKFCINDYCVEKNGENWWVIKDNDKKEANETLALYYSMQFEKMVLVDLVSNNPTRLKDFGFNDDKKVVLKIGSKKIEIGNVGGSFTQTYVRNENSNRVYTSDVAINKTIIIPMEYWIKK